MLATDARLRVAIITSNFWPEQTGIGQVTTEFARFLSQAGIDVSVVTAMPYYPEWTIYSGYAGALYRRDQLGDIIIHRAWHHSTPNPSALHRILHEASLCVFSVANMFRALRNADIAYVVSPDLSLAFVATFIARTMRVPVVLNVQDVMPDAAVELGMLKSRALAGVARRMARSIYDAAAEVHTLSEGMRRRIALEIQSPEKIRILPNTVDTDELAPKEAERNEFRKMFVPDGVFAVVHAGNMGEKQDLDVLLRAARRVLGEADIHFYVFGDGAVRQRFQKRCAEWNLTNVTLLPFQPRPMLRHILFGADAFLVTQRVEVIDTVVPSKLVTAMAAGAMIVAACSRSSETATILERSGGGLIVPSSDDDALVSALRTIKAGAVDSAAHRERVRRYAVEHFGRRENYRSLFHRVRR